MRWRCSSSAIDVLIDKAGRERQRGEDLRKSRDRSRLARLQQSCRVGLHRPAPIQGRGALDGETPRARYVEDWEVVEALALTPRRKAGSMLAFGTRQLFALHQRE